MQNPYAPPTAYLPAPAGSSPGTRWGLGLVGTLGTLEGMGLTAMVLLGSAPAERWTGMNLALVGLVFVGGVAIPAWGVGWHLGRRLERSGFWRGLWACLLTSLAWGIGIMALVLAVALGRGLVVGEGATLLPKLLDREALWVLGAFCLMVSGPTLVGGALTGGILALRRRRGDRTST